MSTVYRPAGTSALERMNTPTECGCCGRSDLKTTVKMEADGIIVWMGTGCAAKAMGVGIPEYRKAAKTADEVADRAGRIAANARSQAEFARWDDFLTDAAGAGAVADKIARLGGFAAASALYCSAVAS